MRKLLLIMLFMSMSISLSLFADDESCYEPDHFISYSYNPTSPPVGASVPGISLRDQFLPPTDTDDVAYTFSLNLRPLRLLNPSTKWYDDKKFSPKRPNAHYASFSVSTIATLIIPPKILRVINQFHSFDLSVPNDLSFSSPELLVPSCKQACHQDDCPNCLREDHYLCYPFNEDSALVERNTLDTEGFLEDQFQKDRAFDRLVPTRFCNPVEKDLAPGTSFSNPTSIHNEPSNHLVCYSMCAKWLHPARFVELLNQFGIQQGFVEHDEEICVPSVKLDITPQDG